ncbi:glycosyltransferase [Dokdonella sp.]|uniref:glycosyltransferase n=1 Tax=Dokdonella sp. TaxID=2291710 RepID=UPI003AF52679
MLVFVQSAPSQLDGPFYAQLATRTRQFVVLYLNGGREDRHVIDPELGFTPIFPSFDGTYPALALAAEEDGGIAAAIDCIRQWRPTHVVMQDQTWKGKLKIALACRAIEARAIVRSDKNYISARARTLPLRWLEGCFVKAGFGNLAPVSPLTANYYCWRDQTTIWPFPYPSSEAKFARNESYNEHRYAERERLGIARDTLVYLSVAKFVDRENPQAVIKAFARVRKNHANTRLVLVGAGSLECALRNACEVLRIEDSVVFTGYLPYEKLHLAFWMSDVFVHLANNEPWGGSAQDALVARMGLITSSKVGAGVCHLAGNLSRFVVDADDIAGASKVMSELASNPASLAAFAPAWGAVRAGYTAESLAGWWADRVICAPTANAYGDNSLCGLQ